MKTLDIYIVKFTYNSDCLDEYCIDSLWEDKEAAEKRVAELERHNWHSYVWIDNDFVILKET